MLLFRSVLLDHWTGERAFPSSSMPTKRSVALSTFDCTYHTNRIALRITMRAHTRTFAGKETFLPLMTEYYC